MEYGFCPSCVNFLKLVDGYWIEMTTTEIASMTKLQILSAFNNIIDNHLCYKTVKVITIMTA